MIKRIREWRPVRAVLLYLESQGGSFATGLAFSTLLAMFPLILGIFAIVGLVTHDVSTQLSVEATVTGVFPLSAREQIVDALAGVRHSAGLLGIVSLLGLLWAGTGLFGSMEFALDQIFGKGRRNFVQQRGMGLVLLIAFLIALAADVAGNALIQLLPSVPFAGFAIGSVAMMLLLIAIYRLVPQRTYTVREVIPGAAVAGVLIEFLTLIFPLYADVSHGFNTYGAQFALFFVLAVWVSFLSQIILLGAAFIRVGKAEPDRPGLWASPPDTVTPRAPRKRPSAA